MTATIGIVPWQVGHASGSISKICCIAPPSGAAPRWACEAVLQRGRAAQRASRAAAARRMEALARRGTIYLIAAPINAPTANPPAPKVRLPVAVHVETRRFVDSSRTLEMAVHRPRPATVPRTPPIMALRPLCDSPASGTGVTRSTRSFAFATPPSE